MTLKSPAAALLLALTAQLLSPQTLPAAVPATAAATKPALDGYTIKLQVSGEWIVGAPLWAIVTFQNDRDKEIVGPPVPGQVFAMIPGCDYALSDPVSHNVISSEKRQAGPSGAGAHPPSPVEFSTLPPHTTMSFAFRLQSPPVKTPSGRYVLTFNFTNTGVTGSCPVQLRTATSQEAPFVKDPDALWNFPYHRVSAPADMPQTLKTALSMDLLCHDLFTSDDELQKYDPDKLGIDLASFYRPILDIFRCEILRDQQKNPQEQELEQKLLQDYPGFKWIFDRMRAKKLAGFIWDGRRSTPNASRRP